VKQVFAGIEKLLAVLEGKGCGFVFSKKKTKMLIFFLQSWELFESGECEHD
jgi:hypothetical protein